MLHHRLTGTEGAGDSGGAALGDGEHGVDDPLAGLEGGHRVVLFLVGTAHTDRPLLDHGQGHDLALVGLDLGHHLVDDVVAGSDGPVDNAADAVGHHDLVEHHFRLRDGTQHVAADHPVTHLGYGGIGPLLLTAQGRHLHAALEVGARHADDLLQRTLDTVVDILNDAGAQLHGQGRTGGLHLGPRAQAGGLLVDLDGSPVAGHVQDLTDQPLLAHADHVRHVGVAQAVGHHQGPGYFNDFSLAHSFTAFLINLKALRNFHKFCKSPAVPRRLQRQDGVCVCLSCRTREHTHINGALPRRLFCFRAVSRYPHPRPAPRRSEGPGPQGRGSPSCRGSKSPPE